MPRLTFRDASWLILAVVIALLWVRESRKERERIEERRFLSSRFTLNDQYITEGWHADFDASEYEIGLDSNECYSGAGSAFIKATVRGPKSYAVLKQHF